jgi:tetratricopeptide (TPR) repeat protein
LLAEYLNKGAINSAIPAMPQALVELLQRCFEKDPARRPTTMGDVGVILQEIYEQKMGYAYHRQQPEAARLAANSLNNKALSLLELGRQAESKQTWEQALKTDLYHPESTYNLGLILWRSARMTDETLVEKMKVVRTSYPSEWRPLYLLAQVHLERGDCESALEVLAQISDADVAHAEVMLASAVAKKLLDLSQRCLRTFEGNTRSVPSVCLSADGRYALSGSGAAFVMSPLGNPVA